MKAIPAEPKKPGIAWLEDVLEPDRYPRSDPVLQFLAKRIEVAKLYHFDERS